MFYEHYSEVKETDWHWEHFKPKEIASRTVVNNKRGPKGPLLLNTRAMNMLQELRYGLGKPIYINSAFRSPIYNRFIRGATRSQHMKGIAFDISLRNQDRKQLKSMAKEIGFRGIGDYNSFVHIDARDHNAYWDSRT